MVRFEKLLWEQAFNIKAFGRNRVIDVPLKWNIRPRLDDLKIVSHYLFEQGILGSITRFFEPILAYLFWKWPRDIALQIGLSLEDFHLHNDRDQRREYLFETINRQSCHPYQHLFFKRRRARYYKVERALRGFYAPEYIRKEAESRLACDTADLVDEWENHVYTNYISDITPGTRWTAMHRLIPLEVFNVYGLFQEEAWNRYFLNEVEYDEYTEEDQHKASNPFHQFNLDSEEGRRGFEAEISRFIDLYPGTIVKDGEQFNFKEFYARYAIANGKDTSRLDTKFVEELKHKIANEDKSISSQNLLEKKVGKSILGTVFPARLKKNHPKVLL